MSNKLNELTLLTSFANTGVGGLFFDPKNIIGAFLCPKGFEIDVTTLQTELIAATHHASKSSRVLPIYDFLTPKDSTEDKTIQTFNTGAKKVVREGYNDWSFQYVQGGLSLLQNLRKLNGSAYDFIFLDADNQLIGIQGSAAQKLRAVPSDGGFFWASPWKVNDSTKVTEYNVQFVFLTKYLNDLVAFVKADFDIVSTVKGLQDVNLSVATGGSSGVYKVTAKTKIGSNLADLYPSILNQIANWTCKNAATGAAVTIETITIGTNADGEPCFVMTVDTDDTDYPGAGVKISFNLVAPAVLQAAGVDGYESTGAAEMVKN